MSGNPEFPGSYYATQVDLKLAATLLAQPPEC